MAHKKNKVDNIQGDAMSAKKSTWYLLLVLVYYQCMAVSSELNKTPHLYGWDIRSTMDIATTDNTTLGIGYSFAINSSKLMRFAIEQSPYIDKEESTTTITNKTGGSMEYVYPLNRIKKGYSLTYLYDHGELNGKKLSRSYVIRMHKFYDRFFTKNVYIGVGMGGTRQRQSPDDGSTTNNRRVAGGLSLRAGFAC
jgi:hypothetical protein